MLKQAVGFALWGSVIAVLGAALGMSTSQSGGYYGYVAGMSFVADGIHTQGWSVLALAAVAGGVAGCATGVVLTICGIDVHSNTDSRVGRVVAAGIAGTVIGVSPALIVVGRSFTGANVGEAVIEWLLLVYAVSAVLGYFGALVAVRTVLRVSGDTAPYRVVRAVAVALPVGAVIATATGMGVAWMAGYSTSPYTFVAVIISVLLILAATFAVACARAGGGPMQGSSRTPIDR